MLADPANRRLWLAAKALYDAGRWSCDRPADEVGLWTELRDALGLAPGTATAAGVGAARDMGSRVATGSEAEGEAPGGNS